ncbi:glycosyltransferase family 2 protein [Ramlibacter sp. H39-3-26]|uniref:glycosyltransferase family 2 protein n=1 Tax=Curvibacter soli TaxID=3031331 RepID=UPI0023D9B31E|nr:glycosyltransferase family 2 protein [Ramlibacter sp. H39-3-26]MDF1485194.1 glycosyltransferase family 2 protein [Ramlibacter sp. H39-3-26]
MPLELTILMPCLNEARTLATCIAQAQRFLTASGTNGEVVVADNGSTDGSQAIAAAAGARVVHVAERGYGAALRAGIEAARGHFVIMGDSDLSYDFAHLDHFVSALRAGQQLVMGNRFAGGIAPGAMPPLHRYLGNPVLSFVGRLFFRSPVRDFHCGLRGFERAAILGLALQSPGMEFASEMVVKATLNGLRITEVPTTLAPDGRGRPPHLRSWRDGWRHLRFLLLFCPRWLFLYPGLMLFAIGIIGFAALLHGPINLPVVGLDIHSLLYMAAATILGAQMIQFAALAKWMEALSGMSPMPKGLIFLRPYLKMEYGLVAGLVLVLVGLIWSVNLLLAWRDSGFGAMDPAHTMRVAIPAVTLMILGVQAAITALFAAALHYFWLGRNQQKNHERV